jgi:anti-anti-sigma factor
MTVIVVFAGEYDLACRRELRREFLRLENEPSVVLDFSGVSYMDSTCIAELLLLDKSRQEKGFARETIVIPAGTRIARIFEVANLTNVFNIVESFDGSTDGKPSFLRYAFTPKAEETESAMRATDQGVS